MGYVDLTFLIERMTDKERNDFRSILVVLLEVLKTNDNHEMLLSVDVAFNKHLMAVADRKYTDA